MRYVCMHKVSPETEAGLRPPKELIAGMGQLIGETAKAGNLLGAGGLRPSSVRYRLTFAAGRCQVTKGPLTGGNGLPASFQIIKVKSDEEAIEWAKRAAAAAGSAEIELGPLTEPWDLGVCPKPEGPFPIQFMIQHKATADSEAGRPPSAERQAATAKLTAEMVKAGVLTFAATLLPSREGVRLRYRDHQRRAIDGPFTESKELIGGFCMVQSPSIDAMLGLCDRFARIIGGTLEIDIRAVADVAQLASGGSGAAAP
jgi:hypothetical protein